MTSDADWTVFRSWFMDEVTAIVQDESLDDDDRNDRLKVVYERMRDYLRQNGYELYE